MTLRGTIHNGLIQPDHPLDLPDGTRVTFRPAATPRAAAATARTKPAKPAAKPRDPAFRIGDDATPIGPADLAAQHDHYLYATPKRPAKPARRRASKPKPARQSRRKP